MAELTTLIGPARGKIFEDVAAVLADTEARADGLVLYARAEGISYVVAASGATDHQVTTAGGEKLYVQPKDGEYYLASWGVDGTGATSAYDDFEAAVELAMADDLPLVLTQERILIDGSDIFFVIPENQTLRMRSPYKTIVDAVGPNLVFTAEANRFTENLAADVERYDLNLTVADASNVKHGDFVFFKNTQARIDTNWNYPKYCIRRVCQVLDDTTIQLDQEMDMWFYTWEGNRNGRDVTAVTLANPGVVTATGFDLIEGDFIRFEDVVGMTELADTVFRIGPVSGSSFDLHDIDNNPVDTSAYSAFTSAEVFKQGQTTVEVWPQAAVDFDNIHFQLATLRVPVSSIDPSTGVVTTSEVHGLTTNDIVSFHGVGGTTEVNENDYRVVVTSTTTFTLEDISNNTIDTTGWTTYTSGGEIRTSSGEYDSKISFSGISGKVTRCAFVGPELHWNQQTNDPVNITESDDFHFDHCHFERGRYAPIIQTGARRTRVTNFTASKIRHIDMAGWAQDTTIGPGVGNDTHLLVQSHPAIRTTWRRITDVVTKTDNAALDPRGVGDVVEDVHSVTPHGIMTGSFGFDPTPPYEDWCASFTRRFTRVNARTVTLANHDFGDLIIEQCTVGRFITGGSGKVYVDPLTTYTETFDRSFNAEFDLVAMDRRVDVPTISAYTSERREIAITGASKANPCVITATGHGLETGDTVAIIDVGGMTELNDSSYTITVVDANSFSLDGEDSTGHTTYTSGGEAFAEPNIRTITGITQANPAVVTSTAHGFSDGEVVWIADVAGMTEVNSSYFIVAGATANTFELTDLDGDNVDSTGYTAYSSGGKVTRQQAFTTVDFATKPNVGYGSGRAMVSSQIYSETSNSGLTVDVPFFLRWHGPGGVTAGKYHAKIRLKAMTRGGYAEAECDMIMDITNNASAYNFIEETEASSGIGGAAVRLKNTDIRTWATVQDEGQSGYANTLLAAVNDRHGITAIAEVTVDHASNDWVVSLDVEMDVRMTT